MAQQIPVDESAELFGIETGDASQVVHDVAYRRLGIVNVAYVGEPTIGGS